VSVMITGCKPRRFQKTFRDQFSACIEPYLNFIYQYDAGDLLARHADTIEVGLDTGRELITKCLWNLLGLQPVIITLTAEVLHLEKVRFPIPILFAEVNTRIQLLQGFDKVSSSLVGGTISSERFNWLSSNGVMRYSTSLRMNIVIGTRRAASHRETSTPTLDHLITKSFAASRSMCSVVSIWRRSLAAIASWPPGLQQGVIPQQQTDL